MKTKNISVFKFLEKFPDEATCEKYIEAARWPRGTFCPHCGNHRIYRLETQKRFKCGKCRKQFSVRTGSIFAESKLPLQKWLMAIWILTGNSKGISSIQLGKILGVTQKTAWFLAHRIRTAYAEGTGGLLGGIVEVDETYIGGKERNKHVSKKQKMGRGPVGKTAVIGIRQRGGRIKSMPISDTTAKTLQRAIQKHVHEGTTIYTDEHKGYQSLLNYDHKAVKHSVGEYVRGMVSTNGVESFWALLKRGYYGIYHKMSPEHLSRYVNEFSFRQNISSFSYDEAIKRVIYNSNGRRITYQELINAS